jgi:AcrR family transcriptional regulator
MVRDAAATRIRILDAAVEEFAAYGLAGARIDRIAQNASANKRALYEHFSSKEGLFAAALDRVLGDLLQAVPLTEDDLPGYAGRVFDYTLEHPEAMRMNLWCKLERPDLGRDQTIDYAAKVQAMTAGEDSSASGLPPTDLIVLVYGLAIAWFINPDELLRADGSDPGSPERLAAHRAALVEAARRLVGSVA